MTWFLVFQILIVLIVWLLAGVAYIAATMGRKHYQKDAWWAYPLVAPLFVVLVIIAWLRGE